MDSSSRTIDSSSRTIDLSNHRDDEKTLATANYDILVLMTVLSDHSVFLHCRSAYAIVDRLTSRLHVRQMVAN